MPEKANSQPDDKSDEGKIEREITQTDKLNKRLLVSCLQLINSPQSVPHFSSALQSSFITPKEQLNDLNN